MGSARAGLLLCAVVVVTALPQPHEHRPAAALLAQEPPATANDAPASSLHNKPSSPTIGGGSDATSGHQLESIRLRTEGSEHEPKAVSVVTAIMLLAGLAFIMTLFYLTHWPNPQIVKHSWRAISLTIVIFCAVLIFNASNGVATWMAGEYDNGVDPSYDHYGGYGDGHEGQRGGYGNYTPRQEAPHLQQLVAKGASSYTYTKFWIAVVQFVVWFAIFGTSIAFTSGAVSCGAKGEKDHSHKAHIRRHLNCKAASMLLAHIAGFAAINAFGILMQLKPYYESPALSLCALLIGVGVVGLTILVYDLGRAPIARKASGDERDLFDEEAEEGGDDMMGLAASFLSVQVLRYALSGQLPDTHGGEPNSIISSHAKLDGDILPDIAKLMLYAFLSAFLCAGTVVVSAIYLESHHPKRAAKMLQIVFAMTHAWCLYFSGVWALAATALAETLEVYEDSALLKVLLACVLSAYAFAMLVLLEKLAALDCTGDLADETILELMTALGILIGFSWEQAFERSVSTVVQASSSGIPEAALKAILAVVLVTMVLPAWRIFILDIQHETHITAKHDIANRLTKSSKALLAEHSPEVKAAHEEAETDAAEAKAAAAVMAKAAEEAEAARQQSYENVRRAAAAAREERGLT